MRENGKEPILLRARNCLLLLIYKRKPYKNNHTIEREIMHIDKW